MIWNQLGRLVSTRYGGSGPASDPQTQGLVITSGWRYDLMLWVSNLATRGAWQALRERTADLAQLQPGESVLDVGCGTGWRKLPACSSREDACWSSIPGARRQHRRCPTIDPQARLDRNGQCISGHGTAACKISLR
jgi:hypothetical protein